MIKIAAGILWMTLSVFGADIVWEQDITAAMAKAEKEHKPLMVLVTKNGCRWCDIFKKDTLKNPKVAAAVSRDFIAFEGVMEKGTVPGSLMTPGTPATWFIKGRTPMFEPVMGAVKTDDFLKALDVVKEEYGK